MIRKRILGLAANDALADAISRAPVPDSLVRQFIAGPDIASALGAALTCIEQGFSASLVHLSEEPSNAEGALANASELHDCLRQIIGVGERQSIDLHVKATAIGLGLPDDGFAVAEQNLRDIVVSASDAGIGLILDADGRAHAASLVRLASRLRPLHRGLALTVESQAQRAEADCLDLAHIQSRVRVTKGAVPDAGPAVYSDQAEIDKAFVRCMRVLMAGSSRCIVFTGDERIIDIARALAIRHGRAPGEYEFQFVYGAHEETAARLAAEAERVRIAVPFGPNQQRYLAQQIINHPASLRRMLPLLP